MRMIAALLAGLYGYTVIARRGIRSVVTRLEGGEMQSVTLRALLAKHHDVHVGPYSYGSLLSPNMADPGTYIGAYCSIGPNVRRIGAKHPLDEVLMHPISYRRDLFPEIANHTIERTPCIIGNDVWIGANVTILPGCRRVGDGSVIGANSVVTRDVDDYVVVAGVPAREIGRRQLAGAVLRNVRQDFWLNDPHELLRQVSQLIEARKLQ